MSIQNEIKRIESNIESAYDAIRTKGVEFSDVQNSNNLPKAILAIDSIPAGAIFMWKGSTSDIPAGYQLCDGTNGTPNFSDKFIVMGESHSSSGVNLVPEQEYSLAYIMKL